MTTETLTLTDFLLARLAEDEKVARDVGAAAMVGARWKHYPEAAYNEIQSTVLTNARRVLAECEAKRRIVKRYVDTSYYEATPSNAYDLALLDVMRDLAAVYADHPDYREEWRP